MCPCKEKQNKETKSRVNEPVDVGVVEQQNYRPGFCESTLSWEQVQTYSTFPITAETFSRHTHAHSQALTLFFLYFIICT